MQPAEESFDHAFGDDLETTQLGNLKRIKQVQPGAGGGTVRALHGQRNVSGPEGRSQTEMVAYTSIVMKLELGLDRSFVLMRLLRGGLTLVPTLLAAQAFRRTAEFHRGGLRPDGTGSTARRPAGWFDYSSIWVQRWQTSLSVPAGTPRAIAGIVEQN